MSNIDTVLAEAKSQLGNHEEGGNDCGPQVREYLAGVGLPEGNPWCAAFVAYCLHKAGVNWWPSTGDTWAIRDWAKAHNILHDKPAVGDVFLLLDGNGNPEHTGLVAGVGTDDFLTVEGNTYSPTNDGAPKGVYSKQRANSSSSFVRWADAAAPSGHRVKVFDHGGKRSIVIDGVEHPVKNVTWGDTSDGNFCDVEY